MNDEIKQILERFQEIGPEVFEQTVRWGIVSNGVVTVLMLSVIVLTSIVWRKLYCDTEDNYALNGVCGGIVALLGLLTLFSTYFCLHALIAPYAYFLVVLRGY